MALTFGELRRPKTAADRAAKRLWWIGIGYYAGAGLQAVASLVVYPGGIADALVLALWGFFIARFQSRTAAVAAAIHTSASAWLTYEQVRHMDASMVHRGNTVAVFAVLFLVSLEAVRTTFAYHRLRDGESGELPETRHP